MMDIEMNDSKVQALLAKNVNSGLIEPILDDLAKAGKDECEIECPKDTGETAKKHYIEGSGNRRAVCNSASHLSYIINGHRVLVTDRSRRWWFAYLRSIGGNYTRKTSGPPGFVPPNAYHRRAFIKIKFKSNAIIKRHVDRFYS